MSRPLEDYALIGDCETAALVARDGSIDWLCLPRFDSGACFAALLGDEENGRWFVGPAGPSKAHRKYRGDTLILETTHDTPEGSVVVVDFMPLRDDAPDIVRIVMGRRGRVVMKSELVLRFDYGAVVPWVSRTDGGIAAIAGPDRVEVRSPVEMRGRDFRTVAEFTVLEGDVRPFVLTWSASHRPPPAALDPMEELHATERFWKTWASRCTYRGPWRDAVIRSLITLKALTHTPTGGIVAAPTTSLPEEPHGVRNWDYRFCWLRDATFTLDVLIDMGYVDEARAWREWLLRAVAGKPSQIHPMYGLSGERRLPELELAWLAGWDGAAPVRIGNDAHRQIQLDVYGEILDVLLSCRCAGLPPEPNAWRIERALLAFLEEHWREPDHGIWEVRGGPRQFTHSKVMAWVAFDRAIKSAERYGLRGPVETWAAARDAIHHDVCTRGFDAARGTFVQSYGSSALDASLLLLTAVQFLPPHDPRVRSTIAHVERELTVDGYVRRYLTRPELDGLPPGEATFLLCSFWLVDALATGGRRVEAEALFERLLRVPNDVGLLAEGYDPVSGRMLGNFPQAFSHIGLATAALSLTRVQNPWSKRGA